MTPTRIFLRLLYALAVTWLLVSLAVQFATFRGFAPGDDASLNRLIAIQHFGSLIVYFPALCVGRGLAGTFRPREYVQGILRHTSPFYRRAATVLLLYAGIVFLFCVVAGVSPQRYLGDGRKTADEARFAEYRLGQTHNLRLFSCLWVACCAVSVVIFASARRAASDSRRRVSETSSSTRLTVEDR